MPHVPLLMGIFFLIETLIWLLPAYTAFRFQATSWLSRSDTLSRGRSPEHGEAPLRSEIHPPPKGYDLLYTSNTVPF